MKTASTDALAAAEHLGTRARMRTAQLRRTFVESPEDGAGTPPLARMLRGGRGGTVRLKLYLSLIWLAAMPPHDASYPARAWATLMDLSLPDTNGARRVNEAIKWLQDHNFLTVEVIPGHPNRVTLLDESGMDTPYSVPGEAYNRLKSAGSEDVALASHRYVQIPAQFWTSGWLATLSAPAVAMLLVMLCEQGAQDRDRELWFSPGRARNRYGLSDETRSIGLNELRRAKIVTARRRPVGRDMFDVRRFRNVYVLHLDHLAEPAFVPLDDQPQR